MKIFLAMALWFVLAKHCQCQDSVYVKMVDSLTARIDENCLLLNYKTMVLNERFGYADSAIQKFKIDTSKQLLQKVELSQFFSDTTPVHHDETRYKITRDTQYYVYYYHNNELIKVTDVELKTNYYIKKDSIFQNQTKDQRILTSSRFTKRNIPIYNKELRRLFYRSL